MSKRPPRLAPASGAIVMAMGIFALAAAPRLPVGGALPRAVAWLLVPLWAYTALAFLAGRRAPPVRGLSA